MKQSTSEVGPAWNFKINIGQHALLCAVMHSRWRRWLRQFWCRSSEPLLF